MKAMEMLRDGYRSNIGEGNVSFWFDKWLNNGPLCNKVDYVHISNSQLRVKAVFVDGSWQIRDLYTPIPNLLRQHLSIMVIDMTEGVTDCRVWSSSISGTYTANEGYLWLLNEHRDFDAELGSWKWIWKLPTSEKCKFLIWLICHEALPTNKLRSSRGIGVNLYCGRCYAAEETSLYCLRDCPGAAHIWHMLGFDMFQSFFHMDSKTWVQSNTSKDNEVLFLAALWCLRVRRNKAVVNNTLVTDLVVMFWIHQMEEDVKTSLASSPTQCNNPLLVSWKRPEVGFVKVNVDGVCVEHMVL